MKVKTVKLEYYVFCLDLNSKKPIRFNIFSDRIKENIAKMVRSNSTDKYRSIKSKQDLKDYLEREFKYLYWARTESEYLITDLFSNKEFKLDIWYQIEKNLDLITEMVNNRMELKLEFMGCEND